MKLSLVDVFSLATGEDQRITNIRRVIYRVLCMLLNARCHSGVSTKSENIPLAIHPCAQLPKPKILDHGVQMQYNIEALQTKYGMNDKEKTRAVVLCSNILFVAGEHGQEALPPSHPLDLLRLLVQRTLFSRDDG